MIMAIFLSLSITPVTAQQQSDQLMTPAADKECNELLALCRQNKHKEAAPRMQALVLQFPNSARLQFNLAQIMLVLGDNPAALKAAEKVISIRPRDCIAWKFMAEANMNMGNQQKALTYIEKAVAFANTPPLKKEMMEAKKYMTEEVALKPKIAKGSTFSPGAFIDDQTVSKMHRWKNDKMPLKVFVSTDNCQSYKDAFKKVVTEAFADWQKRSDDLVTFSFVEKQEGADICCLWQDQKQSIASGGSTQHDDKQGFLSKATVELKGDTEKLAKADELKSTALHEIGHALGIKVHSNSDKDVMFFQDTPHSVLSDGDIATLKALYNSKHVNGAVGVPTTTQLK